MLWFALRRLCSLVLLLAWLAPGAHASLPPLVITAEQSSAAIAVPQLNLLEDPSHQLQVSEVLARLSDQATSVTGSVSLGYSASAYWLGFSLNGPAGQQLFLEIDNAFIDELELWAYSNGQLSLYRASGDLKPFSSRETPYPAFLLALPKLEANSPVDIVLRIHSSSNLNLPIQLVPAAVKTERVLYGWLESGIIVGALLMMGLFHLVKYSALRERQLGYYCAAVLCVAWYYASASGLTSLLLWSDWPIVQPLESNLTGALALIFSSLFILSTLMLQQPWVKGLRNLLFASITLTELLVVSDPSDHRWAQLSTLMMLVTGGFQLAMSILGLYLKRPYARSLVLIWAAVLVFMALLPLTRIGVLPPHPLIVNLSSYLPIISVFLFGVLNGRQLDHLRQALFDSQDQAIGNLEQYQALFRNASEGMFRCSRDGLLLEANPSFLRLLGVTDERPEALRNYSIQGLFNRSRWDTLLAQLTPDQPKTSGDCPLHGIDGQQHWVHLSLYERPEQDYLEGIVVDLSERRALEQRLSSLAAHDPLTGLLNRRELERQLQESLEGHGSFFSHLLYLDLDQFKQVNDLCGHSAGDHLLRQLANSLQNQLPSQAILARLGGDEFAILLTAADSAAAMAQAEALRLAVEHFVFTWEGRPFRLYASIGLLELSSGVSDWETALGWADSASQLAKHQGRNRVHRFNPADGALLEHQRQLQWITRLRTAIEQSHFELFFQAVLPLQSKDHGWHYEVLLRYREPLSIELITPGQFLTAAERYGFLTAIDRWVLNHFCQWLADNPEHARQLTQVNINLSAPSLLDPEFHRLLDRLLEQHQLPANRLCIEVTEMVALGELGASSEWINSLRQRGLKVALDDFGSGFASYAYLRNLPLDILKIDGSFISGIEHDPINQAMVRSMVLIARQLGLQTVAEFVENQASLDCLSKLGIDYAQGYFIGRPQPLALLADLNEQAQDNLPSAQAFELGPLI